MKAFIFPGQGGQFVGQGQAWAEADAAIMDLFKKADDICQLPITKLCFEGPMAELSKTENLQPCVLTVSLAALRLMKKEHGEAAFAAGHSLGEFGALVAASVFDEETALKLVTKRAAIMGRVAEKNPGSMSAVIGMKEEELGPICELARAEGILVMANINTPEQIVISGESRAVAAAARYVKMKGGRIMPLPVSGAFHSELMAEAGDEFAEYLAKAVFNEPTCPVVPNALGEVVKSAAEIKEYLLAQIVSPVRWVKSVRSLLAAGAQEFIEAWPKAYLGSLVKKCLPTDSGASVSFRV